MKCLVLLLSLLSLNAVSKPIPSDLLEYEKNTITVFERASPYVVFVHKLANVYDTSFQAYEVPIGAGSGIVWDEQGHIVTNYHVVQDGTKFAVTFAQGKTVKAHLVGAEPRKDVAILQVDDLTEMKKIKDFAPLKVANDADLLIGQKAIAIGNPFGLDRSLTAGIISALGRRVPGIGGVTIRDMIQTDASINPGNSGGPLLNSRGELIGINTTIYTRSGTSAGVGFAVPATDIQRIVNQIIKEGRVIQPGFGFHRLADSVADQLGVKGIIVAEVVPGTPAATAQLRETRRNNYGEIILGDIITHVNDTRVTNYDDFYNAITNLVVGSTVKVTIVREGKEIPLEIKLIDINDQNERH